MNLVLSRNLTMIPSHLDVKDTKIVDIDNIDHITINELQTYSDAYIESQFVDDVDCYNKIINILNLNSAIKIHYFKYVEEYQYNLTMESYVSKDVTNLNKDQTYKNIIYAWYDSIPSHLNEEETIIVEDYCDLKKALEINTCTDLYTPYESEHSYKEVLELLEPYKDKITLHNWFYLREFEPILEFYMAKKYPNFEDDLSIYLSKTEITNPASVVMIYGDTQDTYDLFINVNKQLLLRGWETIVIEPTDIKTHTYTEEQVYSAVKTITEFYNNMMNVFSLMEQQHVASIYKLYNRPKYTALFIYDLNNLLVNLKKLDNDSYIKVNDMIKQISLSKVTGTKLVISVIDSLEEISVDLLHECNVNFLTNDITLYNNEFEDVENLTIDEHTGVYIERQYCSGPDGYFYDTYNVSGFIIDKIKDLC